MSMGVLICILGLCASNLIAYWCIWHLHTRLKGDELLLASMFDRMIDGGLDYDKCDS